MTVSACACGREFERPVFIGRGGGGPGSATCRVCIVSGLIGHLAAGGVVARPGSFAGRLVAVVDTPEGPRYLDDMADVRWLLAELQVAASSCERQRARA